MIYIYKEKKKPKWEKFFAWWPRPVGTYPLRDGQKMIWLQWAERKWFDFREGSNRYEYQLFQGNK